MSEEQPGQVLDSHCPACRRYVGPEEHCPYCGVEGIKPLSFRLFKRLSLLLAVIGVSILAIAAYKTQPPVMAITDITPLMNHATVTVEGQVVRKPTTSTTSRHAYVGITLNDGSGDIKVAAYGAVAENLIESGMVPERSQYLTITGSLDIRGSTRISLILRSPENLKVMDHNANPEESGNVSEPLSTAVESGAS